MVWLSDVVFIPLGHQFGTNPNAWSSLLDRLGVLGERVHEQRQRFLLGAALRARFVLGGRAHPLAGVALVDLELHQAASGPVVPQGRA
jgi:hypothetical protein